MMTGADIAQVLTAAGTLVAAVGAVLVSLRNQKHIAAVHAETRAQTDTLAEQSHTLAVVQNVAEQQGAAIQEVHLATNGMKARLEEVARREGHAEGVADEKAKEHKERDT